VFVLDAQAEVVVDLPPEEVFPYLSDGERFPVWAREFKCMEKLSEGPIGRGTTFRFSMRGDRTPVVGTVEWVEFDPPHRFSWHGTPVKRRPGNVTPRGTFHIEPHNGGSRVRVVFYPELRGLPKFVRPLIVRVLERSWNADLLQLKGLLEERPRLEA